MENDVLSAAIGTKEHPGRTRGQGVYTIWKDGRPEHQHMYRKRRLPRVLREAEQEAIITQRVTERLQAQMESRIAEQVQSQLQLAMQEFIARQGQGVDIRNQCSPVLTRKSSQASVPDDSSGQKHPVDEIIQATRCSLLLRLVGDVPIEAAAGMAYPCKEGDILHGVMMERGNTKVTVDRVHDTFSCVPLPFSPNDEVTMLGHAVGTFIQWPKKDIVLVDGTPQIIPDDARRDETVHEHRVRASSVETAPERAVQSLPEVLPAEPGVKKKRGRPSKAKSTETRKGKGKVAEQSFLDDTLPFAPLADKYVLGEPWIKDPKRMRELQASQGYTKILHDYYRRECVKPLHERTTSIKVRYYEEHFHHELEDSVFFVGFQDLWEMYNLRSLETCIIRCFVL